jgi:hypothetical protein
MANLSNYLYGIIEEPNNKIFNFKGLFEAPVYTINYQNLAAVVSDIQLSEIDPTRKNVMTHTVVQEVVLKDYTLIPMGFGIVANGPASVRSLIALNYNGLAAELQKLAGKIEVEVKVAWDDKALVNENQQLVHKLQNQVAAATSVIETQKRLSEAGRQVEKLVLDLKAKYVDQIYAALKRLAVDSRLNPCSGVKMLLNASFLIERKKENDFIAMVRYLDTRFQGDVNFKYIGPLSPYNFVSIKLGSGQ